MSTEQKELNPAPLVERLLEKSISGKLRWEATADRKAFVASIGGNSTFKIRLVDSDDIDMFGRPTTGSVPILDMLDEDGKSLWNVHSHEVPRELLRKLYDVARRIGNRLDERLDAALQALERL